MLDQEELRRCARFKVVVDPHDQKENESKTIILIGLAGLPSCARLEDRVAEWR